MSANAIYLAAVWPIPVIIAITFHEAAHGFVAYLLGDDTAWRLGRVSFNPLKHVDPFGTILLPGVLLLLRSPFIFGYAKPAVLTNIPTRPLRRKCIDSERSPCRATSSPGWTSRRVQYLVRRSAYSVLLSASASHEGNENPASSGRCTSMIASSQDSGPVRLDHTHNRGTFGPHRLPRHGAPLAAISRSQRRCGARPKPAGVAACRRARRSCGVWDSRLGVTSAGRNARAGDRPSHQNRCCRPRCDS